MKKILLFASALAGLFLAGSCQRENLEPAGNTVSFTVEAPGAIATKAGTINAGATIADGENVNEVHYAVYKTNSGVDYSIDDSGAIDGPLAQGVVPMEGKRASIDFDLLQDQDFTVIFWAQVKDAGHYTLGDLRTIQVATSVMGNDETRAAFYARYDFSTYEHKDHKVTLKRPFAQLNLLTTAESLTPVQTGQTQGYTIDVKKSEVVVAGLADTFNTLTGLAPEGEAKFVFQMADTPEEQGQETLVVNGKAYHYVSMNYFFVPEDEKLVDIKYTVSTDKGDIKNEIVSVPVKENYRTNIIGNLLTKESTFEIVVDPNFGGQELVPVWDQREVSEPAKVNGQYVISTASELAWLSAAVNGTLPVVTKATEVPAKQTFKNETFVLLEDINLENIAWTPIGANGTFEGTFDGNNKTIKNLNVNVSGKTPAGLFANCVGYIKNLTVENANIVGQYYSGVIVGNGQCARIDKCHVMKATVVSTPFDGDYGNHAGGIAGYISADKTSWVKNCSVAEAEIKAYRDVAALVGTATRGGANSAVITGNKVSHVTVIADQTAEYGEVKPANAGEIVGRNIAATLADNAAENVTVYVLVKNAAQLQNALNTVTAGTVEIRFAADINGDVTVDQQEGKNIVINGDGKKYDGTMTIEGNNRLNGEETVTLKKINFETAAADEYFYFIEQNVAKSYAHNITVEECTFKGGEKAVGARFRQCYDITIKDSKVLSGHSLAQLYGCIGVTIDGVTINADRGVSFGTSTNCSVNNATVVAGSYGFRADAGADLTVQNSAVTAAYPIAVRNLTEGTTYDLNVKATKLTSTKGYQVIFTAADSEDKFVQPAGAYNFTTDAEYVVFPGETVIAYETEGLQAAIKAAQDGDVIYLANGGYFEGLFYVEEKGLTIESLGQSTINGKLAIAASGKTVNVKAVTFENSYDGSVATGHQYLDKTGKYCIGLYCASVNVEGCTFNLSDNGGINFYAVNDPEYCTVKNSTFNCNGFRPIISKVNVTVDGCTFNDQYKYALQVWGNKNNGESVVFTNNVINEAGKTSGCADVYKSYVSVSKSYPLSKVAFTITGNTAGYNFVYDNHANVDITSCTLNGKAIVEGQLAAIPGIDDVKEVLAEAAWTVENGEYLLHSAAGLFWFAEQVNANGNSFSGKTVKLAANIDLKNAAWTPVGQTGATQFMGTFDGQGKTISNLNIDATAQTGAHYSSGLFGWLNAATVKNVNVAGATVKGNHNVGVIAGYLETAGCTIEACHVTGAAVECHVANSDANGDKCGVIVGHAGNTGVVVKDCTAADSTVTAGRDAGQIAGAAKEANVTGCSATNVTVTANGEGTGANVNNAVIGRIL